MKTILLFGQPNSGKSQLFHALTGCHATVGNWAGVTVEAQRAYCSEGQTPYTLVDLPGVYSLYTEPSGEDEALTLRTLRTTKPDLIIHVIDACQLERQLFLTSELCTLGLPLMVVLTKHDVATAHHIHIDHTALSRQLACPVFAVNALDVTSLGPLKTALQTQLVRPTPPTTPTLPPALLNRYQQFYQIARQHGEAVHQAAMAAYQHLLSDPTEPDIDLILADHHYQHAHQLCLAVQTTQNAQADYWTTLIDKWALHRFLGLPLFFVIMYAVFFMTTRIGGTLQDSFDHYTQVWFIQLPTQWLHLLHIPTWLIMLLTNGLGKGLNTTFTLVPILATMYFFLSLLENSGYMARVAFIMDRTMRAIGLPGKAFVPLLIGFGCNVPAILATRTLETTRDRMLTTLMTPFMSCSARLTLYTVFVSAFFPRHGSLVIFSLYLLSMIIAICTGLMFRSTFRTEPLSLLLLSLPTYHTPPIQQLIALTWLRLRQFLKRALTMIIPICMMLSLLQGVTFSSWHSPTPQPILSYIGQMLCPLFAPMGLSPDNWPAVVGLFTGFLAKEVVLGTLNTLYQPVTMLASMHPGDGLPLSVLLQQHFHNLASVYSYLTFTLLYLPCLATTATIKQETSSTLMWFAMGWSLFVAYGTAILLYQLLTLPLHPQASCLWLAGLMLTTLSMFYAVHFTFVRHSDVISSPSIHST